MSQLQELEATIHQRRLYLQGQDNQLQRNQDRLQKQKLLLDQNEADLKRQKSKLNKLSIDNKEALTELKAQAEKDPSDKVISLRKEIRNLRSELFSLNQAKGETVRFLEGASETLGRLDNEIIEADTIYKDLLVLIEASKKRLKQAERDASFQVAIVSDLQNDVRDLHSEYKKLEASKIYTLQEKDRLSRLVKTSQSKLDSINNELAEKQKIEKNLELRVAKIEKNLDNTGNRDKVIREALAIKELKLQEDKLNIKTQKAEMKKDLLANQQLQPKLKLPKKDNSKGYYKI